MSIDINVTLQYIGFYIGQEPPGYQWSISPRIGSAAPVASQSGATNGWNVTHSSPAPGGPASATVTVPDSYNQDAVAGVNGTPSTYLIVLSLNNAFHWAWIIGPPRGTASYNSLGNHAFSMTFASSKGHDGPLVISPQGNFDGSTPVFDLQDYIFDWGDGSPLVITTGALSVTQSHTFAPRFQGSGLRVRSRDVRGWYSPWYRPNIPPLASFTSEQDEEKLSVDASNSRDYGGSIASYLWTWGDGTTTAGTGLPGTTTHEYQSEGTYNVSLQVTDNNGTSHTSTRQVTIEAPNFGAVVDPFGSVLMALNDTQGGQKGVLVKKAAAGATGATTTTTTRAFLAALRSPLLLSRGAERVLIAQQRDGAGEWRLYRSLDDGRTWQNMGFVMDGTKKITGGDGLFGGQIGVVIAYTVGTAKKIGFRRSSDAGATWPDAAPHGLVEIAPLSGKTHARLVTKTDGSLVAIAQDGTMARSTDTGANWVAY